MRYIDADKMREEWLENGENEYVYDTNSVLDSIDAQPTADVVEVEKVAKMLTDVTGIAPCEMVGANEWDDDYCNCAELCSQSNYKQCWERYLKHSKG